MSSFQFIHTADIHLDSPLTGLAWYKGSAVERIWSANRETLDNLISQPIEDEVRFVVIAGDLCDGTCRDFQTGLFFSPQMGRLGEVGIDSFLLYGNHDAESQVTKRLSLPDNVNVFSSRKPGTFLLDDSGVASTARASVNAT
ncbi:MAG: metallophosphoesterase family protein [Candidatus Acidiferrales bacterium]